MESFEDFFKIYRDYAPKNNYQLMDNLFKKLDKSPTEAMGYLIMYYNDIVRKRSGQKYVHRPIPELYAYTIWVQIYLGDVVDIYTTDSLDFIIDNSDDEDEEEYPKYMKDAFEHPSDMLNYVVICAIYAIITGNIPVLEQALQYDGVLDQIQHHRSLTELMMKYKPNKTFLSYVKDKIFKDKVKVEFRESKYLKNELRTMIDLDFRFSWNNMPSTLSIEEWDLLFGLRDFPLFSDRHIRAIGSYYDFMVGDIDHFNNMIREWREFYQTPERKTRILDIESAIRKIKMELNDLMSAYNLFNQKADGDLLLTSLNTGIQEAKLKLLKLEEELAST